MALDLARWQFALTTVYHFLLVPLSIGLSLFVAVFQTAWQRTGSIGYLHLTRWLGRMLVINFALGVVTGIVQEFQFGMGWSFFSRFVGDIFGVPLALEGLLAFFLESTFLGLWVFGWGRLPRGVHLTTIWVLHIGTVLSAYFILTASSFMQHPVGFQVNPDTNRAELTDIVAVLTNQAQLVAFPHVLACAWLTGAAFVMSVCVWHLWRSGHDEHRQDYDRTARRTYRSGAKAGAWLSIAAGFLVFVSGDLQGKIMTEHQPMKMAAAEGLYQTTSRAGFSLLTIGTMDGQRELFSIRIPGLLSFLATGSIDRQVAGIDDVVLSEEAKFASTPSALTYSSVGYAPLLPLTYWSFRIMIGAGVFGALVGVFVLYALRTIESWPLGRLWLGVTLATPLLPLVANSAGWIFTEMGRQPWTVFGELTTEKAVSAGLSLTNIGLSLVIFTVLYSVLAVIEVRLMLAVIRAGATRHPGGDLEPEPDLVPLHSY